jgi:hypothetical protein
VLESLDTLIAFVLIMLVVSLLITIAVQIAAAVFNLRGLNLLSGLTSTFGVIAPGMEENHKGLADYLLKGELLSDSWLPNSFLQKWRDWLRFSKFLNWLNHWRHASAIRPGDRTDMPKHIATSRITVTREAWTPRLLMSQQTMPHRPPPHRSRSARGLVQTQSWLRGN